MHSCLVIPRPAHDFQQHLSRQPCALPPDAGEAYRTAPRVYPDEGAAVEPVKAQAQAGWGRRREGLGGRSHSPTDRPTNQPARQPGALLLKADWGSHTYCF